MAGLAPAIQKRDGRVKPAHGVNYQLVKLPSGRWLIGMGA
jgi:hypothetical protein